MSYRVFFSYSHHDGPFVEAVAELIRATGTHVFRDKDNIPLGETWRPYIAQALMGADTTIVFWSGHSAESSEVQNEYRQAISLKKNVVPVMLDNTPLPADLAEYNGLDLTPFFQRAEANNRRCSASNYKIRYALVGLREILPQLNEDSTEISLSCNFD